MSGESSIKPKPRQRQQIFLSRDSSLGDRVRLLWFELHSYLVFRWITVCFEHVPCKPSSLERERTGGMNFSLRYDRKIYVDKPTFFLLHRRRRLSCVLCDFHNSIFILGLQGLMAEGCWLDSWTD